MIVDAGMFAEKNFEKYIHASDTVEASLSDLFTSYFKLKLEGLNGEMDNGEQGDINDLMFLAFLKAHRLGFDEFNKAPNKTRENFQRQFVAWKAIMEAYVGFGYLDPRKAMQIDIMDMVVHTDTQGKVIQTLGLLPARNDVQFLGLPTLNLYEIPIELQDEIHAAIKAGKKIVELGRFARSGTINYVRQKIRSNPQERTELFESWIDRKLNEREKVYYNLRLILSALKTLRELGADSIIANIADQGKIFIKNEDGMPVEIELKGAAEFFEPIVEILGGKFYDATWKEEEKENGPFAQYAKGHDNIRIAFIPEINYAKVGKVLLSKFTEFFGDKRNKKELNDLNTIAGSIES